MAGKCVIAFLRGICKVRAAPSPAMHAQTMAMWFFFFRGSQELDAQ